MFKALALSAAVLLGGFFMPAAQARELFCANDDPADSLKESFGELPYAAMITHSGLLQIVYLNIEKGNWSIVMKPPNKEIFCFISTGENWTHWTTETKKKEIKT